MRGIYDNFRSPQWEINMIPSELDFEKVFGRVYYVCCIKVQVSFISLRLFRSSIILVIWTCWNQRLSTYFKTKNGLSALKMLNILWKGLYDF